MSFACSVSCNSMTCCMVAGSESFSDARTNDSKPMISTKAMNLSLYCMSYAAHQFIGERWYTDSLRDLRRSMAEELAAASGSKRLEARGRHCGRPILRDAATRGRLWIGLELAAPQDEAG